MKSWRVESLDGVGGQVIEEVRNVGGEPRLLVELDDGRRLLVPPGAVVEDGTTYRLRLGLDEIEAYANSGEQRVIPVIAEELVVEKRQVETGRVRVRKIVHEREETVDEALLREEVIVERVPVGQVVAATSPVRHEGETMIVPVYEEVLVVERRLMLKEELRITRRRATFSEPQQVRLREEEVIVERTDGGDHPID